MLQISQLIVRELQLRLGQLRLDRSRPGRNRRQVRIALHQLRLQNRQRLPELALLIEETDFQSAVAYAYEVLRQVERRKIEAGRAAGKDDVAYRDYETTGAPQLLAARAWPGNGPRLARLSPAGEDWPPLGTPAILPVGCWVRDYLEPEGLLDRPADTFQVRVDLASYAFDAAANPLVRRIAISYSGVIADQAARARLTQHAKVDGDWARRLDVPYRTQKDTPAPLRAWAAKAAVLPV